MSSWYGYTPGYGGFHHSGAMRSYYNERYGDSRYHTGRQYHHHHSSYYTPLSLTPDTKEVAVPYLQNPSSTKSKTGQFTHPIQYSRITAEKHPICKYDEHQAASGIRKLTGRLNTKLWDGFHNLFHFRPILVIVIPLHIGPHDPPPKPPLEIQSVDLCIEDNSVNHHTDKYEISQVGYFDDVTKKYCSAQLILRRGQEFTVKVNVNRKYTEDDHIRVIPTFGPVPLASKGTHNEMIAGLSHTNDYGMIRGLPPPNDWFINVVSSSANQVELSIKSPPNCAVGKWDLLFDTVSVKDGIGKLTKEIVTESCYILFNCWCKEDPVYMENEAWRNEYVLNDTGKLYVGNYKQIYGKPWNFGQFDSCVLEAALFLLTKRSFFSVTSTGNPIAISRKLSALVNSNDDDGGVLTALWDGDCGGGVGWVSPTMWTGSVAILRRYMESGGKPVKYGHCWVFSGVMTTVCRALGIPTRSITNFASAHDADDSLTIDVHWDDKGQPIPELDTDTVWPFHVWNECWMTRPDLQPGYGGWQVVDATPQVTSGGLYCAGPASVVAIKNGDVGNSFDTPFIFAEVNADKKHWILTPCGSILKTVETDAIGRNISTKAVGPSRDFVYGRLNPDREDITDEYKYPEGSRRERAAVQRALSTTKPYAPPDDFLKDVEFVVTDIDNVMIGQSFTFTIEAYNSSSYERSVHMAIGLSSVYYTGVERSKLKRETFFKKLSPHSRETFRVPITYNDYEPEWVKDGYAMKISYFGRVEETNQIFLLHDDFRLRTPIPELIPSVVNIHFHGTFKVKVKFTNPLNKTLTNCMFSFEAAGNLKLTTISRNEVKAGATIEVECEVTANRVGDCIVISSFECTEMIDVQAQCTVVVNK